MSKHTPGPWQLNTLNGQIPAVRRIKMSHGEADTFQSSLQACGEPPFKHVCRLDFGYGKKEDEANARLLAAAPELLEALKQARVYVARAYERAFPDLDENDAILKEVDAAIAKAEGAQ